jgi:anti-sigma regulatory factor (Ser/Thr protein kinase)
MIRVLFLFHFILTTLFAGAQSECTCSQTTENNKNTLDPTQLLTSDEAACKIEGYRLLARALLFKRELDSSEIYINKALKILASANCSQGSYLIFYQMLDNIYANKADFKSAIEMELKIISIFENKKDTINLTRGLLNVSNIFNEMQQPDKGIDYCRKAIPMVQRLAPSAEKAVLLARAAQRYFYYYQQYNDTKYLDSTAYYANAAQKIMQVVPFDKEATITVNNRLITVAIIKKQYPQALVYIDQNLSLCNRQKDFPELSINFRDKAAVYFNTKQFVLAKQFADSSLAYTKLLKSPPTMAETYQLIYEIAEASGNSREALEAYKAERIITDSVGTAQKMAAVTELEKKYNQAKNEKTIKELAQQKQIYLLFGLAGLLTAAVIAFFLRQQSLKHKQKILETEQRLNRARMNPHFFFNALASLQSFAIRENDGEAIASNLSKFSHIMRETLESTYKEYVTVEQEIDFLNEYLDVQKIRFPRKFDYEVIAANNLEVDELQLPAMIIQPFVENSIEHGFSNIDYTGLVTIEFNKSGKDLRISITDNGKGLITTIKENLSAGQTGNEHISRASQIIKDRIYLLNVKLKTKASFSIDNNPAGKGVQVIINLPLIYIK